MDFQVAGQYFGKIMELRLQGRIGLGYHRLEILIKYLVNEYPADKVDKSVFHLQGDLYLEAKGGSSYLLAKLTPDSNSNILQTRKESHDAHIQLSCELDNRRIESIEEVRCGGDFRIRLDLWGIADGDQRGLTNVHSQTTHDIEQSQWVKVLQGMGYAKYLLIEVPVPNETEFPRSKDAVSNLQKAQQLLIQGHYNESVGTCRKVIEALKGDLGFSPVNRKEIEEFFGNTKELDKPARIHLMLRALEIFCHPTHHFDENSRQMNWTRADATAAISMSSQLLSWLAAPQP